MRVSAPGKLFILGEHGVVYDGKAIVTAVNARLTATLQTTASHSPHLVIDAPDVGLSGWKAPLLQGTEFVGASSFIESCVAVFYRHYPFARDFDLMIETRSDFGAKLGLGSSSATVAAVLFGLAQLLQVEISRESLFAMGVEAIQQVQRLGSGADLAAAIYGGTVYYVNREPRQISPIEVDGLPLLIAYSGEKAGTVSYVQEVGKLKEEWPEIVEGILQTMLKIVEEGRECIWKQDWEGLGQLMNMQHGLLHSLGVDSPALSEIVFAARQHGALGAKLSGAGGGDCAIILTNEQNQADIIAHLGVLDIGVHAEGVRIEPIS